MYRYFKHQRIKPTVNRIRSTLEFLSRMLQGAEIKYSGKTVKHLNIKVTDDFILRRNCDIQEVFNLLNTSYNGGPIVGGYADEKFNQIKQRLEEIEIEMKHEKELLEGGDEDDLELSYSYIDKLRCERAHLKINLAGLEGDLSVIEKFNSNKQADVTRYKTIIANITELENTDRQLCAHNYFEDEFIDNSYELAFISEKLDMEFSDLNVALLSLRYHDPIGDIAKYFYGNKFGAGEISILEFAFFTGKNGGELTDAG